MLDLQTFDDFIKKANVANQQLSVWFYANNQFAKYQTEWRKTKTGPRQVGLEKPFNLDGPKCKNFWNIVIPTLQHGWVLSTAKLFDPAYHPNDKKRKKPRISLEYLLIKLNDTSLTNEINLEKQSHDSVIKSLKELRDNFIGHNGALYIPTHIEAGVEKLFSWLEQVIAKIKKTQPELNSCGVINIEYNYGLSEYGVDEIFEALLKK